MFHVVSVIAWLVRDWRQYAFTLNVICVPLLFAMFFFVESPRWLVQKHRLSAAAEALNKIACVNGRKTEFDNVSLSVLLTTNQDSPKHYTAMDLFSSRELALYSVVLTITAVTVETIPAVLLFNVQDLAGSPFLNVSLYGLLRLWTPAFMVLLEKHTEWFGRRALFIASQGFVSLCFVVIIVLYAFHDGDESPHVTFVRTALALAGAAVNVGCVWVAYKQYVTELYPTNMRATALGFFAVVSVLGLGLAPQLVYLARYWPALPYSAAAMLAVSSLISGTCVLPETSAKPLPDSLCPPTSVVEITEHPLLDVHVAFMDDHDDQRDVYNSTTVKSLSTTNI